MAVGAGGGVMVGAGDAVSTGGGAGGGDAVGGALKVTDDVSAGVVDAVASCRDGSLTVAGASPAGTGGIDEAGDAPDSGRVYEIRRRWAVGRVSRGTGVGSGATGRASSTAGAPSSSPGASAGDAMSPAGVVARGR